MNFNLHSIFSRNHKFSPKRSNCYQQSFWWWRGAEDITRRSSERSHVEDINRTTEFLAFTFYRLFTFGLLATGYWFYLLAINSKVSTYLIPLRFLIDIGRLCRIFPLERLRWTHKVHDWHQCHCRGVPCHFHDICWPPRIYLGDFWFSMNSNIDISLKLASWNEKIRLTWSSNIFYWYRSLCFTKVDLRPLCIFNFSCLFWYKN